MLWRKAVEHAPSTSGILQWLPPARSLSGSTKIFSPLYVTTQQIHLYTHPSIDSPCEELKLTAKVFADLPSVSPESLKEKIMHF